MVRFLSCFCPVKYLTPIQGILFSIILGRSVHLFSSCLYSSLQYFVTLYCIRKKLQLNKYLKEKLKYLYNVSNIEIHIYIYIYMMYWILSGRKVIELTRTKFHWYFQTYSSILHQNSNLIFWFINDFYYCCDCKKWEQNHWVFKCKNNLPSRVRKYCSKCKIRLKSSANILHKPEYEAHHQ